MYSFVAKIILICIAFPLVLNAQSYDSIENLYLKGEYWQAAQSALNALDEKQGDAVDLYLLLGNSLLKMHLHQGAEKAFRYIVEHEIASSKIPVALHGLQRVEYDRVRLEKSLSYYDILLRGELQEPLKSNAAYFAGMVHYKQNNYPRAIKNMLLVQEKNENYVYAQYTIALSLMRMRRLKDGLERLEKICVLSPKTADERYVVNEARLSCGYANYEMERYDIALLFFQTVSPTSVHYENALLAAGWAAVQLPDYLKAITLLTELVDNYSDPENVQEALFLLGHSHLRLQQYDQAVQVYDQLISTFDEEFSDPMIMEEENQRLELERKRIKDKQLELHALETRAANILAFGHAENSPEQQQLLQERSDLFNHIRKQRQELEHLAGNLEKVTASAAIRQQRRNWKVYAEFGKMRAMFLKRRQAETKP